MPTLTVCACGCGETIAAVRTDGKPKRFALGHNGRAHPFGYQQGAPAECWEWLSRRRSDAEYGIRNVRRPDGTWTTTPAHRWVYEQRVGPIPDGAELDHRCNNRGCVNPAHLRLVNRTQNMRRASNTKLDMEAAREIRRRYVRRSRGPDGARALALQFGVDVSTIHVIARGEIWKEGAA